MYIVSAKNNRVLVKNGNEYHIVMVKSYDEAVNKIRELEEELAKYKKCTSL